MKKIPEPIREELKTKLNVRGCDFFAYAELLVGEKIFTRLKEGFTESKMTDEREINDALAFALKNDNVKSKFPNMSQSLVSALTDYYHGFITFKKEANEVSKEMRKRMDEEFGICK